MKYLLVSVTVVLLTMSGYVMAQTTNPRYDKKLADSLGADDYGMKKYVLVILKTGPVSEIDKKVSDSLFAGHMQNMSRMVDAGKLIVAGPLQKNDKNYRGIFILNVKTTDEAKALLQADPAVKAGLLDTELFGWYGSAALPLYLPAVPKIEKKTF